MNDARSIDVYTGRLNADVRQSRDLTESHRDLHLDEQQRALEHGPRMTAASARPFASGGAKADAELVGRGDVSHNRPLAGTADRAAGNDPA